MKDESALIEKMAEAVWDFKHDGRKNQILDVEWYLLKDDYIANQKAALAVVREWDKQTLQSSTGNFTIEPNKLDNVAITKWHDTVTAGPPSTFTESQRCEWHWERHNEAYRMLLATMQENEKLKKHPLKLICEKCNTLTDISNKDSETP